MLYFPSNFASKSTKIRFKLVQLYSTQAHWGHQHRGTPSYAKNLSMLKNSSCTWEAFASPAQLLNFKIVKYNDISIYLFISLFFYPLNFFSPSLVAAGVKKVGGINVIGVKDPNVGTYLFSFNFSLMFTIL